MTMKRNPLHLVWAAAEVVRCILLASILKSILAVPLQDTLFFSSLGGVQLVFPLFGLLLYLDSRSYSVFSEPLGALKFAQAIPFAGFVIARIGTAAAQNFIQNQGLFSLSAIFIIATDISGGILLVKAGKENTAFTGKNPPLELETHDGKGLSPSEITTVDEDTP